MEADAVGRVEVVNWNDKTGGSDGVDGNGNCDWTWDGLPEVNTFRDDVDGIAASDVKAGPETTGPE